MNGNANKAPSNKTSCEQINHSARAAKVAATHAAYGQSLSFVQADMKAVNTDNDV